MYVSWACNAYSGGGRAQALAGSVTGSVINTHRHDAVGEVERLLDAVAMVNVDVYIQHAMVLFQELQDGKNNVVDVAEAGSFCALGMVHASGPVES